MRILAFTGNRSDYDLVSPLFKLLKSDSAIEFKLIVSGAHLSESHGYSIRNISTDGHDILKKIESIMEFDDKKSRLHSADTVLKQSIDVVDDYDPDLIIYAGDREEVIVGSLIGCYLEKPTMHFWSGDHATDGN